MSLETFCCQQIAAINLSDNKALHRRTHHIYRKCETYVYEIRFVNTFSEQSRIIPKVSRNPKADEICQKLLGTSTRHAILYYD